MKRILGILMIALCVNIAHGQDITQSIYNYKDVFKPLFSKKSSVLNIDFAKMYNPEVGDTTYRVIIDLQEDEMKQTGSSFGVSVFKSNMAFGSSASYQKLETREQTILNKDQFFEFHDCIKKVHSFISKYEKFEKSPLNTVATCGGGDLIMGGEFTDGTFGDNVRYYFRLGDNATYSMEGSQFIETVQMLNRVKKYWEKR